MDLKNREDRTIGMTEAFSCFAVCITGCYREDVLLCRKLMAHATDNNYYRLFRCDGDSSSVFSLRWLFFISTDPRVRWPSRTGQSTSLIHVSPLWCSWQTPLSPAPCPSPHRLCSSREPVLEPSCIAQHRLAIFFLPQRLTAFCTWWQKIICHLKSY